MEQKEKSLELARLKVKVQKLDQYAKDLKLSFGAILSTTEDRIQATLKFFDTEVYQEDAKTEETKVEKSTDAATA